MTAATDGEIVNEVHIVGRISHIGEEVELPSGDKVIGLRVVVRRSPPRRGRAGVDALEVALWDARLRRRAAKLRAGDTVEVRGALHRRFFRAGGVPTSRYEISADSLDRLAG